MCGFAGFYGQEKEKEEILQNIQETVDVISVIKPTFNFKAAE